MQMIDRKIKLGIDEPWDSSKVIDGKILGIHQSEDGRTYFSIEDTSTRQVYVVCNRYQGHDLLDIFVEKIVIVAIALPIINSFSFDDPNFPSLLSYYGIGHVELY